MASEIWDKRLAEVYDRTYAAMFEPSVLDPMTARLAELAAGGSALEFAVGTGRVALPLAARGVSGFTGFRDQVSHVAPLRRNIEQSDIGDMAAFLCSPAARNLTGEVIHLDAGFHIMGLGTM